ncbi:hypothetical protein BS47DRAFT_432824 [Hydnum rufescens UP504]|uniref:Uncharacterized protein n=1 Tax=Hydnum rufescens UP504 TaxID=1448309 RepID=A0A9P6AJF5_9AGAM|nr:hypothetical protein BS47DRAFT_432824 [Hydnum rufescens UP504]
MAPSESQATGSKNVPNRTSRPTSPSFSSMSVYSSPAFLPEDGLQRTMTCSPQTPPTPRPTALKPNLRSLDKCPPSMDRLLKLFPDHVPPSHRKRIIGIPLKHSDIHRRNLLATLEDLSQQSDGGFMLFIKDLDAIERFHPVKRPLPDEYLEYSPPPSSSRSSSPLPGLSDEIPSLITRQLNKRRALSRC